MKKIPLCLGFALGSVLLSGTLPAKAQTGNQSDISGASVTSSSITSGAFTPQYSSNGSGIGGGGGSTVIKFATPSAVANVNKAAGAVSSQLGLGKVPVIATNISPNTVISAAVQQVLQSVLTQTGSVGANSKQIVNALTNTPGSTSTTLAQKLVSNLKGLTAGGKVSPTQLVAAVKSYNAVIDTTSNGVLSNPPQELLAIQSVLATLVNAASTAK